MKIKLGPWTVALTTMLIIILAFIAVNYLIPSQTKPVGPPETNVPQGVQVVVTTPDIISVLATLFFGDLSPSTPTPTLTPSQTSIPSFVNPSTHLPIQTIILTPMQSAEDDSSILSTSIPLTSIPSTSVLSSLIPSTSFPLTSIPPTSIPPPPTQISTSNRKACNDNVDNDSDGKTDDGDPECKNPGDDNESQ